MTNKIQRYYWLKLKDDFFKQKELKKLRNIAGGDTYTIIYLKMQLLSLKNGGKLIYDELEDTFAEELALELDEKVDDVKMTLAFLNQTKLIEVLDNKTEFLLPNAVSSIGSETSTAERMRKHRDNKKCNNVTPQLQPVTNGYTDIEKEIDIEKDTPYSPPQVGNGGGKVLDCIKSNGYQFNNEEIQAIYSWFSYKFEKKEPVLPQQIELLLKQLERHRLAKQDIVFLIEKSISSGYKGIMEPSLNSPLVVRPPATRYQSDEYIIPET